MTIINTELPVDVGNFLNNKAVSQSQPNLNLKMTSLLMKNTPNNINWNCSLDSLSDLDACSNEQYLLGSKTKNRAARPKARRPERYNKTKAQSPPPPTTPPPTPTTTATSPTTGSVITNKRIIDNMNASEPCLRKTYESPFEKRKNRRSVGD
eukprot:Pgem_evm1s12830